MVARKRVYYALAVVSLIILGISSRKLSGYLPTFVAEHSGDMLWAAMVYFGFRCLFPRKGLLLAFMGSLIFSFFIEFSQLYQADWINTVRDTTLGALVLGHGFLAVDLLRYFVGIIIAWFADWISVEHISRQRSQ